MESGFPSGNLTPPGKMHSGSCASSPGTKAHNYYIVLFHNSQVVNSGFPSGKSKPSEKNQIVEAVPPLGFVVHTSTGTKVQNYYIVLFQEQRLVESGFPFRNSKHSDNKL